MDRPGLVRVALVAAVVLCAASIGLVARPADTPSAIKQSRGWHKWWWNSDRVEDPLYRNPEPVPYAGVQPWRLAPESSAEILFRLDYARGIYAPFVAVPRGEILLDTLLLDTLHGSLVIDLSELVAKIPSQNEEVGDLFTSLPEGARKLEVLFESAHIGTAPHYPGTEAIGDVVLRMPGVIEPVRVDVDLDRVGPDRIRIRSRSPVGCVLPDSFDRLDRLAAALGAREVPSEIAISLQVDLVR